MKYFAAFVVLLWSSLMLAAMPASGPITFSQMQTTFGGSNPIGFNEYYRNGGLVPTNGTTGSIATSGTIVFSTFYGAAASGGPTLSTTGTAGNLVTITGYRALGSIGSMVSATTSDGKTVTNWYQDSVGTTAVIAVGGFGGDPGQNGWATSFKINAVIKTAASASSYSYNAGAGIASWTWNAATWSFVNGVGFTADIT